MKQWRRLVVGGAVAGLFAASPTPVRGQHPVEGMEWMVANLRPSGQPVIPIFDGWFQRRDGRYTLCFGYFNLNLEQALDVPLGSDNFIQPDRFNGNQPTYFEPVPPPPHDYRRRFCSFTVDLPPDFSKDESVVWTLRVNKQTHSVPGRIRYENYQLEEAYQQSREVYAPVIRLEPSGPETRGRNPVKAGPLTAAVGRPLPLTVSVRHPEPTGNVPRWYVRWSKHQGPAGSVRFSPEEQPDGWLVVDVGQGETTAATSATFSEPGEYVLRLEAIDDPGEGGSYQFHCCWTHLYVRVNVTP